MRGIGRFFRKINWWVIGVTVFMLTTEALAAEGGGNWRGTYDLIMMYVNFLILVFLFLKFGKTPIKNYLNGQKEEIAKEISELEGRRDEMVRQVKETVGDMAENHARFKEIKERIISRGEARKKEIIEAAGNQSRMMIEDAQRRLENRILSAKKDLKSDLVDGAMDLAMENIGSHITEADNDRFLKEFLASFSQK